MLDEILKNTYVLGVAHLVTSATLLIIALIISSVVRMNKGAKVNTAIIIVAAGVVVAAIVPGNIALDEFGLVNVTKWNELLLLLATALVLIGVMAWRRIIRRMVA